MKSAGILFLSTLLAAAASTAAADRTQYAHAGYFEDYEGAKTCLECHEDEAKSFFHSQHYQWEGETPDIVNSGGRRLGKMNTINDFCTNPAMNWIGESKNEAGDVVAKGCSKCDAGFGLLPAKEISREQLENIDGLICHASGYRRDLYTADDGTWEWRSILWKNRAGLNSVSKRKMCLRCHSASGSGAISSTLSPTAIPHSMFTWLHQGMTCSASIVTPARITAYSAGGLTCRPPTRPVNGSRATDHATVRLLTKRRC